MKTKEELHNEITRELARLDKIIIADTNYKEVIVAAYISRSNLYIALSNLVAINENNQQG